MYSILIVSPKLRFPLLFLFRKIISLNFCIFVSFYICKMSNINFMPLKTYSGFVGLYYTCEIFI